MKILHTADWHLGKKLEQYSRLEEQKAVLNELYEYVSKNDIDVVVVAGDIFDNFNPSAEAEQLLYSSLTKLGDYGNRLVVVIAGNHDSPDRIEAPSPLAMENGIIFCGFPLTIVPLFQHSSGSFEIINSEPGFVEVNLKQYTYPLRIIHTSYVSELRFKKMITSEIGEKDINALLSEHWSGLANKYMDNNGVNLLVSHLYVGNLGAVLPVESEDERSVKTVGGANIVYTSTIPSQIQYSALGHIHKYYNLGTKEKPIVYSSSILSYSFSEAGQQKYFIVVDVDPSGILSYVKQPIESGRKLVRLHANGLDEALRLVEENSDHFIELTLRLDRFFAAEDRVKISALSETIVNIIPVVNNANNIENTENNKESVLTIGTMDEMFKAYFTYKHNIEPTDEIMNLFSEILSSND